MSGAAENQLVGDTCAFLAFLLAPDNGNPYLTALAKCKFFCCLFCSDKTDQSILGICVCFSFNQNTTLFIAVLGMLLFLVRVLKD